MRQERIDLQEKHVPAKAGMGTGFPSANATGTNAFAEKASPQMRR
jgi:hypothetical protein